MSPAKSYKRAENKVLRTLGSLFKILFSPITRFFTLITRLSRRRFTVMFIPHSEQKVFNYRISFFTIIFLTLLIVTILVSFFLLSTQFNGIASRLEKKDQDLEKAEASLEVLLDEIVELRKISRNFEATLDKTLSSLGLQSEKVENSYIKTGDLSNFFDIEEQDQNNLRELSEIQHLRTVLSESIDSLDRISGILTSQSDLLVEMPTLWPIEDGLGYITLRFGPAEHPFTHQPYLHKGIDISYLAGTPIIATANGKVIEKGNDIGFGKYIVIWHKFGFATKYAHLNDIWVDEGDWVTQGQRVGIMGSTGLSTGRHLHYEVRLGSQVLDPARFLTIKNKKDLDAITVK